MPDIRGQSSYGEFMPRVTRLIGKKPKLLRVLEVLGPEQSPLLLGATRTEVSDWVCGRKPINLEMRRRIATLDRVLVRVLRLYDCETAAMWLVGSEPLLGGARPIDVLAIQGPDPLIRAIEGIAQGAYA